MIKINNGNMTISVRKSDYNQINDEPESHLAKFSYYGQKAISYTLGTLYNVAILTNQYNIIKN